VAHCSGAGHLPPLKNAPRPRYCEDFQRQVTRKVEAFERFINLNAIALGLLQVLVLEMPNRVWAHFPLWFRTLPRHGYPREQIVRLSLQPQKEMNLAKSMPALLSTKLLADKIESPKEPDKPTLAT